MSNPIWIIVDYGDTFEGHQGHWEDNFFSNASRVNIKDFCKQQGMVCEIREMTEAELLAYPEAKELNY